MKKQLSLLLILVMVFTMVACAGDADTNNGGSATESPKTDAPATEAPPEEDPFLTEEKPELNVLMYHTPYNLEEQPSYKVVEELTGYKINYFNLPQENADEKLLLEIGGGTSYDLIMKGNENQVNQLYIQNALLDLKPYLDKYGEHIYANISQMSLDTYADENGMIYGMPYEAGNPTVEDPYGKLIGGIGFNTNYLEDLGITEAPTNLDDFYTTLKAYTDKTGKPAFTQSATGWNTDILTAFGMGTTNWYEVEGEYIHRIKHPGTVDYLAFMQKIYKEELLDNDFPINTGATSLEKFTNGTTLAYPVMFYGIDSIHEAFGAGGIDTTVKVATALAPDANTAPTIYIALGMDVVACIPKTAEEPEHAIIWFNMISDPVNFETIYIGEEGVSYEIIDEGYYPIFPAFNEYTNSDKFAGVALADRKFEMWQARARKTPLMAELYNEMNTRIGEYEVFYNYEAYAASLEAVQDNKAVLDTMINDSLIQAIVSGADAQTAINNIIAEWDSIGGIEYEAAMKTWYEENKGSF